MMGELEDEETEAGEERLKIPALPGKIQQANCWAVPFWNSLRSPDSASSPPGRFLILSWRTCWRGHSLLGRLRRAGLSGKTTEGQPAQEAGMAAGDVITAIEGRSINFSRDIQLYNLTGDGSPMEVAYKRYEEASGRWRKGVRF